MKGGILWVSLIRTCEKTLGVFGTFNLIQIYGDHD